MRVRATNTSGGGGNNIFLQAPDAVYALNMNGNYTLNVTSVPKYVAFTVIYDAYNAYTILADFDNEVLRRYGRWNGSPIDDSPTFSNWFSVLSSTQIQIKPNTNNASYGAISVYY